MVIFFRLRGSDGVEGGGKPAVGNRQTAPEAPFRRKGPRERPKEGGRVAATRATNEELDRLSEFAATHVAQASHGASISAPSISFHRLVAEASHNRLLIAVALLLLDPVNDPLEKLLEGIAVDQGATLDHVADHLVLAQALRAAGQREAAAREEQALRQYSRHPASLHP